MISVYAPGGDSRWADPASKLECRMIAPQANQRRGIEMARPLLDQVLYFDAMQSLASLSVKAAIISDDFAGCLVDRIDSRSGRLP